VAAVVHPNNSDIMFVSANAISFSPQFFVSEGIYVSTDGGTSFFGSDTCSGGPSIAFHGGDPGIAIDKNGTFILTRIGKIPFYGLYTHNSSNMGSSWSNAKTITSVELERAYLTADNSPNSQYYGRVYAAWVRYSPPFPFVFSYSDDGGVNWSAVKQINNPSDRNYGGGVVSGKDGTIYTVWAAVTSSSPFTEKYTGFAKSTNGGDTWSVTESAFLTNGIQGILPTKQNIRVNSNPQLVVDNSGGSRNGWLYIITTQKNTTVAGSDPDIILNRSTDGGLTWSGGIRVNQDALNNGKIQFFPAVTVDDFGGLSVIFYDDRATTSDSAGVFLARSLDGGDTWKEYEISGKNFLPTPIGGLGQGYQGDNISIVYRNNTLHPFWMDNTSGIYQIRTVKIPIALVDVKDDCPDNSGSALLKSFKLGNAYPNPFNPTTVISFELPVTGVVTINAYNSLGQNVATLLNEEKTAGTHSVTISGDKLPSGTYFVRANYNGNIATTKILLLK
jgi:hypothetical protein